LSRIALAEEDVNLLSQRPCDLDEDVRRRAKTVKSYPLCRTCERERAVTDHPRAQKRGCMRVGITVGDGQDVALVGRAVGGKPPIALIARVDGACAQVFTL
jgi:hypothetical protein